ncbi:glutamate racemase [Clostridium botulinum]|uniref:glutamate racemase n=1 Tax=Clostridium botulinum TaxID=1491 RepID=UPI001FA70104|nr:glutamate racemase [Clostridium botulinum]
MIDLKVVLVKENNKIRVLEGKGTISSTLLAMRSRLTSGDIQYYELDFDTSLEMRIDAYVEALNQYPELLEESKLITKIQ